MNFVVAGLLLQGHPDAVLNRDELLARLNQKVRSGEVRNADIARLLDLPSSRIPGLLRGERKIYFDEGVRLIEAFELEPSPGAEPLPHAILRLVVAHVAETLGAEASDELTDELAEDLAAFARLAADPQVRESEVAAGTALLAMRLRPRAAPASRSEIDRLPV